VKNFDPPNHRELWDAKKNAAKNKYLMIKENKMPHANVNGSAQFVTPRIAKRGKDGKLIFINDLPLPGASALALSLAYVMEVAAYTSDKDNRTENKTARKAAIASLPPIKAGDGADVFMYHMPDGVDKDGNLSSKWLPIMEATREELIKVATLIAQVDSVLEKAEAASLDIVRKAGKFAVTGLNPIPSYGGGGRAKRSGGVINITI